MGIPAIPIRPKFGKTKYSLTAEEMDCLTWIVVSGCSREDAFLRFVRPDYLGARQTPAVKEAIKQFFASSDVMEYLESYRDTIKAMRGGEKPEAPKKPAGTLEERKAAARLKATEFAMELASNIEEAEDPEFVLKMMDKVGLLEREEEAVEQPRRYLPVQCRRECRYRLFCEENTADECRFCRYRQYGEENGVHYEPENQLDVPVNENEETSEN